MRTADSCSLCPRFSFLSGRSSPLPKPCGTRRACPLRGAWARTGASWLPTARRLSTPAPLCGRAPDWPWCRPTYRENQKRSSALNSTRPQNRQQKNRPYSNDATKLSNRADKVDFERNRGPLVASHTRGATARHYTVWRMVIAQTSVFPSCTFKELVLPLRVKQVGRKNSVNLVSLFGEERSARSNTLP